MLAKNTGEYALILAAPDQRSKSGDPPIWIADAKLSPFINATVPLGFGFAIVDAKGLVQMHSITNRSLQENLFRECDEDPELRGAIFSRRSEWLTVRYYGDDYRMHTLPIEGTPFSTVAFYDIRVFQAACSGILSAWLWSSLFVRASVLLMSSDRRNSDARIQCEMAVAEP